MSVDDITLMALADGELDADEARAVERAIEGDLDAQARLDRFRRTRDALRMMPAPTHDGDQALIAQIRAAEGAPAPRPTANFNRAPWAALAAGAAVLAIGLGWWLPRQGGADTLQAALSQTPSGQGAVLDDGTDLTVLASFRTEAGTLCREIEATQDGATRLSVMCRDTFDAPFEERFAMELAPAQGYQPASGEIEALEAFLARIGAGNPLTPEDEAAALSR
ncbi:anti-sigma factor family protein [Paracoccus rhizosphaerae]|uniref:Anti-sigma factor family protein n=1 Tax=Paracoccus rhizosphaerae TaxID=1133347 RepID=A0ABV6CEU4_9RHOB|nr:hypothetical protein [Paracoccus rhizosphaerae]